MPIFADVVKNAMLDATNITTLSLHTAYSAAGGNEVVGGTPAYARMAVTFAPAANGQKALAPPTPTFDVPACTALFVGMWSGAAFEGMEPLGGDGLRPFSMNDFASGTISCAVHGFAIGDTLVVWAGSQAVLPPAFVEGTMYYVVTATADTLQVSTLLGGVPLTSAASGSGFLQRIMPVTWSAQGTFPVQSFILDARAAG